MTDKTELYKTFENKLILIVTHAGYKYKTSNLKVYEDVIKFTDKYSNEVMISISEIQSIQELKRESMGK